MKTDAGQEDMCFRPASVLSRPLKSWLPQEARAHQSKANEGLNS